MSSTRTTVLLSEDMKKAAKKKLPDYPGASLSALFNETLAEFIKDRPGPWMVAVLGRVTKRKRR